MTSHPRSQPDTESAAFAKAYPHLDLDQIPDPWGRPIFKHSHVRALWEGWFARACLDDRAQCAADFYALWCDECNAHPSKCKRRLALTSTENNHAYPVITHDR